MTSFDDVIIPRCDHLTVHTNLCMFCGMTVCDDCLIQHKLLHAKKGDSRIPKKELEN